LGRSRKRIRTCFAARRGLGRPAVTFELATPNAALNTIWQGEKVPHFPLYRSSGDRYKSHPYNDKFGRGITAATDMSASSSRRADGQILEESSLDSAAASKPSDRRRHADSRNHSSPTLFPRQQRLGNRGTVWRRWRKSNGLKCFALGSATNISSEPAAADYSASRRVRVAAERNQSQWYCDAHMTTVPLS
jgi:hypothetical protein